MFTQPCELSDLFQYAKTQFDRFVRELTSYGINMDSPPKLKKESGFLCYYDLDDGAIYLSLPDPAEPLGKLQILFMKNLLGLETDGELAYLIKLFIPRLLAHEIGHYLRHRYGKFGNDMWYEEQVANLLASAMTKLRLNNDEMKNAVFYFKKVLSNLSEKMEKENMAVDSYHNFLEAMCLAGELGASTAKDIEIINRLFSVKQEDILKESAGISVDLLKRLNNRQDIIREFNDEYTSNIMRYIYYQTSWMVIDFESGESQYVDDFIKTCLNIKEQLVPYIETGHKPGDQEILSVFRAHMQSINISETASRYFYKRYRTLLLARLDPILQATTARAGNFKKEAVRILEAWDQKEPEILNLILLLVPQEIKFLFPRYIGDYAEKISNPPEYFTCETDKEIYNHLFLGKNDDGAANTLYRLELFDRAEIYQSLPAEILIELASTICRVKLEQAETIIWEGRRNDDVFIVVNGELEVIVECQGQEKRIGLIQTGEVFGEMAFLTHEPRSATVRAVKNSECFAIKASDLHLLAFKYPIILMHMAKVIAKRLTKKNPG